MTTLQFEKTRGFTKIMCRVLDEATRRVQRALVEGAVIDVRACVSNVIERDIDLPLTGQDWEPFTCESELDQDEDGYRALTDAVFDHVILELRGVCHHGIKKAERQLESAKLMYDSAILL